MSTVSRLMLRPRPSIREEKTSLAQRIASPFYSENSWEMNQRIVFEKLTFPAYFSAEAKTLISGVSNLCTAQYFVPYIHVTVISPILSLKYNGSNILADGA